MSECNFKPYQKVLVRDAYDQKWHIELFEKDLGIDEKFRYMCLANTFRQCILYEGNEHLLGTADTYVEPYEPKDGDFVYYEYSDGCKYVSIFKGINRKLEDSYAHLLIEGAVTIEDSFLTDYKVRRAATEEEKQLLLSKLHEQGKDWDAENKQIVGYVAPYLPQNGDFVYCSAVYMHILIFSHKSEGNVYCYADYLYGGECNADLVVKKKEYNCSFYYSDCKEIRLATDDEKNLLLSKLQENGKDWDAETKQVVAYAWCPKEREEYWFPSYNSKEGEFYPHNTTYYEDEFDNTIRSRGQMSRTKEDCQAMCSKLNAAIKNVK